MVVLVSLLFNLKVLYRVFVNEFTVGTMRLRCERLHFSNLYYIKDADENERVENL